MVSFLLLRFELCRIHLTLYIPISCGLTFATYIVFHIGAYYIILFFILRLYCSTYPEQVRGLRKTNTALLDVFELHYLNFIIDNPASH